MQDEEEQSPRIVAASLSPLSPKPISVQSIQNTVVSKLQDQAATAEAAAAATVASPAPPPLFPNISHHRPVPLPLPLAMDPMPEQPAIAESIVTNADAVSDVGRDDNESINYSDGDERDVGQEPQDKADPDAAADANDDYAKTFDSPIEPSENEHEHEHEHEHQGEADEAQLNQPGVPEAAESMNAFSVPMTLPFAQSTQNIQSTQPSQVQAQAQAQTPAAALQIQVPASAATLQSPSAPPGLPGLPFTASTTAATPAHEQANGPDTSSSSGAENPFSAPKASPPLSPAAPNTVPSTEETLADPSADATPVAPPAPVAAPATAAAPAPQSANEDDAAVDIQKLVNDLTAKAAGSSSASSNAGPSQDKPSAAAAVTTAPTTAATLQATPTSSTSSSTSTLPAPSHPSLPPKPNLPPPPASLPAIPPSAFQPRGTNGPVPSVPMNSASAGAPHGTYMPPGAPGAGNDGIASLPPHPSAAYGAPSHLPPSHMPSAPHYPPASDASAPGNYHHGASIKQLWEQFLADEKRYTSEAKWERFPEGSRIFIGNLSSERVTKREVFDVFHRFGRLAQISLKNAYGFVQYHTVAEGQAAMLGAQGIELGGRRIHLEVSRTQKKKEDRDRSPNRRRGREDDRFNGGDRGWRRDDYRPGRSPSPRRGRDGYGRDRDFGGHGERRRSRSPRYGRYGDEYRRRSPSPHRRVPSDADRLDLPRRFGADVPDVQFLLLQEVSREFVNWVQGAFHNRGLKTDVMYLNPRFPRDTVVQRQVVEGVHAIVDLDYAAQSKGKIPIQVFIRSGGSTVRFELYQDIDPPVAAELVIREKNNSAAHLAQPQAPTAAPYAPHAYAPPAAAPPAYAYPYAAPAAAPVAPAQPAAPAAPDLTNIVGQLDNNALQALLSSLQTAQAAQNPAAAAHSGVPAAQPTAPAAPAAAPQIDVNALLGNLRAAAAAQQPAAPAPAAPPAYGYGAAAPAPAVPTVDASTAQHVQSIIDTLKRAAQ